MISLPLAFQESADTRRRDRGGNGSACVDGVGMSREATRRARRRDRPANTGPDRGARRASRSTQRDRSAGRQAASDQRSSRSDASHCKFIVSTPWLRATRRSCAQEASVFANSRRASSTTSRAGRSSVVCVAIGIVASSDCGLDFSRVARFGVEGLRTGERWSRRRDCEQPAPDGSVASDCMHQRRGRSAFGTWRATSGLQDSGPDPCVSNEDSISTIGQ